MTIQQQAFEADALYRQMVEEQNKEGVNVRSDIDFTEAEDTWWEITATEAAAFMIPPDLCNALACAHERYLALIGISCNEFMEYMDEERKRFPDFFDGEGVYSKDKAPKFMSEVCGLPFAACLGWSCRYQIQLLRSGLYGENVYDLREDQQWQQATIDDY